MIDLSNNNTGHEDFRRIRRTGQQRVYLKLTEGTHFVDKTFRDRRREAVLAELKVGAYHFARPSLNTPHEEADYFLQHLPRPLREGHDLRPCLDLEDPHAAPRPKIGRWAIEFIDRVQERSHHVVVIYGSPGYLEPCDFPPSFAHTPLWLASYGRNNGEEHPYKVPPPWNHVAAHQYASTARVAGVRGRCDISHVYVPDELDVAVTR